MLRTKTPKKIPTMSSLISQRRLPSESFQHLHFGHGLGIGVGLIGWAVEMKEGIGAICGPFVGCKSVMDIMEYLLEMPNATFAGVTFWIATLVSSTLVLFLYVMGRVKLK